MSGPEATGRTVVAFGELLPLEEADRERRLAEIAARDPSWAATLRGLLAAPATGRLRPLTRLVADDETGPSLAGLELGNFRLVEPIAAGGMGEVWRARQERPDREVAVKVIRRSLADDRLREADLLGRLRHPSLATVHASGVAATPRGEFAWIAMELIEGGRDLVKGLAGLPLERRLALFVQAAEGVAFAHSHGVLHRDLKPSNILLDLEGRPKVIDFGIARFSDADLRSIAPDATAADFPAGTPAYLAPEAFDAGLGRIDARGDVYSLGVILHQVAFGSLPTGLRAASPLAVLEAARTASFDPPPGTPRSLRGDLAAIVRRATARDPERRYPTVEALVADVRNFLARRPVTARPRGTAGAMALAFRRQPLVASLAAALVLLLVVATAVSTAFAIRAGRSLETARIAAERRDALIAALNTAIGLEDDRWIPDPDLSMRDFLRQRVVAIAEDAARGPYQVKLDAWIPALETLEIVMVRLGLAEDALVAAELHEDLVQLREKGRPWSGHLGEFRRLIARAATDPSDSTAVEAMRAMVPVMLRSQAISRASDSANLLDVDLAATPRVNFLVADAIESSPGAVDDPEAIYAAGYLRILALRKLFTLDEPVPPDEFRAAAATLLDPKARAAAGFQPDLRVWVLQLTLAIAERDGLVRQPELAGDFVRLCLAAPFVSGRPGVIAATLQRLVEREEWTAAGSLLAAIERHGGTESPECLAERLMLDRCHATIDRRAGRLTEGLALLQHAGDLGPSEINDVRTGREHARTLGLAARLAIEAGCDERAIRFREALARNEAAFRDGTSIVRSDPYRDELAAIDLVHPMPAAP